MRAFEIAINKLEVLTCQACLAQVHAEFAQRCASLGALDQLPPVAPAALAVLATSHGCVTRLQHVSYLQSEDVSVMELGCWAAGKSSILVGLLCHAVGVFLHTVSPKSCSQGILRSVMHLDIPRAGRNWMHC